MKIRTGDIVQVITGKYRSKVGAVKKVLRDENKVVVEGVNMIKRHVKSRTQVRQAGIIQVEAPIHVSNVMLVEDGEPTRVGYRMENGEKVRFSKNTGKVIPDRTGWQNRDRSVAEDR